MEDKDHKRIAGIMAMLGGKKKKASKEANGKGYSDDDGDEPSEVQMDGGAPEVGKLDQEDGSDHPDGKGMTEDGEATPGQDDVENPGSPALHQKKGKHLFGHSPHRVNVMVAISNARKKAMGKA